jgi:hypothetical protein
MKSFSVTYEYEMTPEIEEALNFAVENEGSFKAMYLLSAIIADNTELDEESADQVAHDMYATKIASDDATEDDEEEEEEYEEEEEDDDELAKFFDNFGIHALVEPGIEMRAYFKY